MSFASSASSTLVPILPKYPTVITNSAGHVFTPTLLTTNQDSATAFNIFSPYSLFKGVWLLTGTIQFNAVGGQTFNGGTSTILVNGVAVQTFEISASPTSSTIVISCIIPSGEFTPNETVTVALNLTTSGGGQWAVGGTGVQTNSVLKFVRIA